MIRPRTIVVLAWLVISAAARAEDLVITSSASDPAARIKRPGTILDYTAALLKLQTPGGREEAIPAARVVEIQTAWTPPHEAARAARLAGKLDEALASFEQAKQAEARPWAQRQIAAELSSTYLEAGRIDRAVSEFLPILAADPGTRHWDQAPLPWRSVKLDHADLAGAVQHLKTNASPYARLFAASWLVDSEPRESALAALQSLSEGNDRRLSALARIQLWRSRLETASTGEIEQWPAELEKMPLEIQAAGWFVLGAARARQDDQQRAALAYLKVPLLFRQQRAMAADALLAAGYELQQLVLPAQAERVYRELVRDFPHLPPAAEAQRRLDALLQADHP